MKKRGVERGNLENNRKGVKIRQETNNSNEFVLINKRGFAEKLENNKKGFELAIGTLIVIILGFLLLISILLIWNYQTGIFSDFLRNLQGRTNVDAVVTGCNTLANQNAVYEYCCVKKKVKYEDRGELKTEELNCLEISNKTFINNRIEKLNCISFC